MKIDGTEVNAELSISVKGILTGSFTTEEGISQIEIDLEDVVNAGYGVEVDRLNKET